MSIVPISLTDSSRIVPTVARSASNHDNSYPTRDGRPMGETDLHRTLMYDLIETLKIFYEGQQVYVSGNLLLFYRPGNKRRHVSPDVLVTKGLEMRMRKNYLLWEERLPPNVVMEVTSESTKDEDIEDKFEIYRDDIRVNEYFLFDPYGEYLKPQLQGYHLVAGKYVRIELLEERLPSEELGLHLEPVGSQLRLYDPTTKQRLPTPREQAEAAREQAEAAREQAQAANDELARLRKELEQLKKPGAK